MKSILKIILILCAFILTSTSNAADAQDEKTRSKIGIMIKSADRVKRAKSMDRLKAGDLLRIYVHPEKTSYVYVIHSDLKKATFLNIVQQKIRSSTLVMPSIQDYYQVDGESPSEHFTIIVSPRELSEELGVFKEGEAPHSKWAEIEKALMEKSRITLSQKTEKPFSVAGNVRGGIGPGNADPFVTKLQIFSGKSVLVKKYEFRVKK